MLTSHVLSFMVIAKLVFLKMEIEQKTPKHIIKIGYEILHRSCNTIATKAVVSKNTVSWVIILYKEVMVTEWKSGSGRKIVSSGCRREKI